MVLTAARNHSEAVEVGALRRLLETRPEVTPSILGLYLEETPMIGTETSTDEAPQQSALHSTPQSEDDSYYDSRRFRDSPTEIPKRPMQGPV